MSDTPGVQYSGVLGRFQDFSVGIYIIDYPILILKVHCPIKTRSSGSFVLDERKEGSFKKRIDINTLGELPIGWDCPLHRCIYSVEIQNVLSGTKLPILHHK